jgi:hypothetical protein
VRGTHAYGSVALIYFLKISLADPDPDLIRIQSGYGFRRAKMTYKKKKKVKKINV